ncbi:hypothetical protein GMOD_00006305 [Pyrenophora seminiperda CCB06]|uniref:Uncharacterized protein n=1 Tax=Pyrenophora seminiperda CCB06 TaxID=1302712 RepID=A0A3M7M4R6_9PLEO|nr:hypothetical protein GMOD_00006305 [Pyrenophora seminiperda CCB06]
MASPPGSITTVSGRRCTRSRARTAASSTSITTSTTQESAAVSSTEAASSTSAEQPPPPPPPPPQQTTTAEASSASQPPPPPPAASSTTQAAAVAARPAQLSSAAPAQPPTVPSPSTTDAANSATGTIISVPRPLSRITPLALPSPSPAAASPVSEAASPAPVAASPDPAATSPDQAATSSDPVAAALVPAPASSGPATAPPQRQPKAKATIAAVPSAETSQPPPAPIIAAPAAVAISSDIIPVAAPTSLVATSSPPGLLTATSVPNAPNTALPFKTGPKAQASVTDSPVLAGPKQSSSSRPKPNPISEPTPTPSGGVAGGLIAPNQAPPSDDGPLTLNGGANAGGIIGGVFGGLAALALISGLLFFCLRKRKAKPVKWNEKKQESPNFVSKLKAIPTGVTSIFARMKGNQAGPMSNPYQRHQANTSIGSVYSRDSIGRARSSSEPQGFLNRPGSNRSRPGENNEGNGLRKKPSSISSNFRFPGIQEDTGSPNPFADPNPHTLLVLNPDPRSAPVTPRVPAPTVEPEARDPFASILDPPGAEPVWAGVPNHSHQRTMSTFSTLSSHAAASLYSTYDPFRELSKVPPLPTQAVLSRHTRNRSSMAVPGFDAMSTFASRDSDMYFGEPGPSRRGTNMYTPVTATYRTVRQSDPFDLDRPEVLKFSSFGNKKDSVGNLSRYPSRRTRVSSIGNWPNGGTTTEVATTYGLFPQDGTKKTSWAPPPMPPAPLQPNGGKI